MQPSASVSFDLANLKAPVRPKNIIYILADDHRYDFMGFTGKVAGLKTPNLDRLAAEGAHVQNAFVSTALCSPSRASIL
ncbi:MAG: acetylglucosamine-6-sulfatase, partial [Cytophagaceae bacterium]